MLSVTKTTAKKKNNNNNKETPVNDGGEKLQELINDGTGK